MPFHLQPALGYAATHWRTLGSEEDCPQGVPFPAPIPGSGRDRPLIVIGDPLAWAPVEGNQNRTVHDCIRPEFPMVDFNIYKGAETHTLTDVLFAKLREYADPALGNIKSAAPTTLPISEADHAFIVFLTLNDLQGQQADKGWEELRPRLEVFVKIARHVQRLLVMVGGKRTVWDP